MFAVRNLGGIMLLLGVLGFFYANGQLDEYEPVPPGLSIGESLDYPAGRWEMARYGLAALAGFGLLMAMFPKGR
jgi:hypothetical protein